MASCCRKCLQISCYVLVAFIAALAYFHIQCTKEKELAEQNRFNDEFDPDMTDVADYSLKLCALGSSNTLSFGIAYMLVQAFPCALVKLVNFLSGAEDMKFLKGFEELEDHNVTFIDARKNHAGDFHDTGFTLIELDDEPLTKDWRSTTLHTDDPDVKKFQNQMEPYIRNLYPDAKRLLWTYNVVRGGDKFGDQPKAINGPHLDYHQNNTARKEFHSEHPPPDPMKDMAVEARLLMGESNTDEEKLKVMLGIWIPIRPNCTVCDNPLAVMDARTFDSEHQTISKQHINFLIFMFNNLASGIAFDKRQRWYYFPFMTTKEVLVFHQYSEDRFFANPHTSFNNRNCPKDSESRLSAEMRVALFF